MSRIMILGATSAIAQACIRQWARTGREFVLVGRNREKLESVAADAAARGAETFAHVLDMTDSSALARLVDTGGEIDLALIAHGTLPDQVRCESDGAYAKAQFNNNASSTISALTLLSAKLEAQGRGQMVVISSVAGDRGRPSNYLYGSAKAAVNAFCEGLQARLHGSEVQLLVVKPGFVDTPMTYGLDLPARLTSSPDTVARCIDAGIGNRRHTIYTPFYWRYIMWLIRAIPASIFRRLDL